MLKLRWGRCILVGLAAFATSLLLTVAIVFGYAFRLGFEARGAPDQRKIQEFARIVGPLWGPILLVALTLVIGVWVSRKEKEPVLHGTTLGLVAAIFGLLPAWPPDFRDGVVFAAVAAAGCLGGVVASMRRGQDPQVVE